MNITLRKANVIQASINDAIKGITENLKAEITLSEFLDPVEELKKARKEFLANDNRRSDLLTSLYEIRSKVGTANVNSGIDVALANIAFLDKRIAQLQTMVDATPVIAIEVIAGKLNKAKTSTDRAAYYMDAVTSGILTQEDISGAADTIKQFKKQKQSVKDDVVELNIKNSIVLSESTVDILTKENLI